MAYGLNALLTNLTGLEGVTQVGSSLSITDNAALTSIEALYAWPSGTVGQSLSITNNPKLNACDVQKVATLQNLVCNGCGGNYVGGPCN